MHTSPCHISTLSYQFSVLALTSVTSFNIPAQEDGQHDSAIRTMTEHTVAFHQELFLDCVQKVTDIPINMSASTTICRLLLPQSAPQRPVWRIGMIT